MPVPISSGNTRTIMSVTIAIVGCLDTKGEEMGFLREVIENTGNQAWVIDTGVLEPPAFEPDTTREAVAEAGGASLAELLEKKDRGFAMSIMSAGAAAITSGLFARSEIDGMIAAGGSANTTIGSRAMQALPIGFPKMLVSTLACGDVSAWVGTRDITLMYSVVDIAGINRISAVILRNAANAVVAMAAGKKEEAENNRPLVAASMFGVTTPCVTEARRVLEEHGFEVIVFHATGAGGRTMETLIAEGYFAGVLDLTTTELADERIGGILSAGPQRLTAAGLNGTPQVVSTGATDMVNFGGTTPAEFDGRLFYKHNPTVTLMRTTADECGELGREIAEKVSAAKGPAAIMLPLSGVSAIDREGEAFDDPAAREALFEAIRQHPGGAEVSELPCHINDPEFAEACARRLIDLIRQ